MRRIGKLLAVFVTGGLGYGMIELICRGYTFISMGVIGGICMVMIHLLNEERRNGVSLIASVSVACFFIISIELLSGEILNRLLGLKIWSYSSQPFNLDGQICLLYAVLWFGLAFAAICFDEVVFDHLFHRERVPVITRRKLVGNKN